MLRMLYYVNKLMQKFTDVSVLHQSTELMELNNEWTYGPDLPTLRTYHCITPMTQDPDETRFVLIGGQISGANQPTTFLFDWSWNNDSWVQLGSLPTAVFWHACGATKLSDGRNIVLTTLGMNAPDVQFLDEGTTQWYAGPAIPFGRQ